ncbi:uncharacterized protein LOC128200723 [Galleria mellonella]|uniref:Uncharacterized protein LOC128200723 n=1 Tax=Galleria mellonella TaxID=7137 RepID=A0ABM3MHY2_GALME|nr:uncharacterized protein LOC128200723 [Galleria mellonella]
MMVNSSSRQDERFLSRMATPRDLPTYSGDCIEWLHFKSAYQESTRVCQFSDSENLWRLRRALRGDAKEAVTDLLIGNTSPSDIMSALELRFGRSDIIIQYITTQIKKLPPLPTNYQQDIVNFSIKINNCVATLNTLKLHDYLRSPELVSAIASKLPSILISKFTDYAFDRLSDGTPKLMLYASFLKREAEMISAISLSQPREQKKLDVPTSYSKRTDERYRHNYNNKQVVFTTTAVNENNSKLCQFCKKCQHLLPDCRIFKRAMRRDRWYFVKNNKLCYCCLLARHDRSMCAAPMCDIDNCGLPHHRLLHYRKPAHTDMQPVASVEISPPQYESSSGTDATIAYVDSATNVSAPGHLSRADSDAVTSCDVMLKIVKVKLSGPNGTVSTYALLDDGASISMIDSVLVNELGLESLTSSSVKFIDAFGVEVYQSDAPKVCLRISGHDNCNYNITLRNVSALKLPMQNLSVINNIHCKHLSSVKQFVCTENVVPRLLIGEDNYFLLAPLEILHGNKFEPYATRCRLGWSIHGNYSRSNSSLTLGHSFHVMHSDEVSEINILNDLVQNSYKLDCIGISTLCRENTADLRAVNILDQTARNVNNRWEVGLPFVKDELYIPDSYNYALSRLQGLLRKFKTDSAYAARIPDIENHTSSLLDLLLTTHPDGYTVRVDAPIGSSDHCLIRADVPNTRPDPPRPIGRRRVWHYKSADWDGLREFYASYPWKQLCFASHDPNDCAIAVSEAIIEGMKLFIPNPLVAMGSKKRPWFNRSCKKARFAQQAAYKAWTTARTNSDPEISDAKRKLNAASRSSKRVIARAKFEFVGRIGRRLSSLPSGNRAFWSLAKAAQGNFCQSSFPPLRKPNGNLAYSAKEKADLFGILFASNSTMDEGNSVPPTILCCGSSMPEITITQCKVRRELLSLDVHKSSGPDGIPAVVLKQCAPELCPVLTRLFTISYSTGQFPSTWKTTLVHPVPKKGDKSDPSNYRPIAIASLLSKVMERIVNAQLLKYLEDHDLLSDRQYGFRHSRSTGDLLVYLTHRWASAIESQGEALAVGLDIAKAFDRVWHRGLLSKLPYYGLPDSLCKWVASFLSGRRIKTVVDGCCSDSMDINAGVPQGSVLSPTLFLLHINDMLTFGSIHCYADDSTGDALYTGRTNVSRSIVENNREQLVSEIERTLTGVSDWGRQNLVQFNPSKTQACAFTAKKTPFAVAPQFQGTSLNISKSIGILGVDISSDVQFRGHLEDKVKLASKNLGVLNRAKHYFTPDQRLMLYKSQIRPHMEYCCHLWAGAPRYQLEPFDSVQRRAMRIVDDPMLASGIEPLSLRRDFASLCVFYRLYNGLCSEELFNMMPTATFYHRTARHRQGVHPHTLQPKWSRTTRFQRCFLPRTLRLWNELPAEVFPRDYSMGFFKRGVKRFLQGRQRARNTSGIAGVHRLR